ncbi:MAG: hypothetical protein OEZ68_21540 [Gammaproteobacteria bacterium]|nr:hypothetical protein [Gammaproteobacteria bacterium]MDH5803386.1 hypothetical protein [Gammaproteobacteria bacterium]
MTDFEKCILGETDDLIHVDTKEESRLAVLSMTRQAHKSLHIYTHDFDTPVYDNGEFVEAAKQLAIRVPHSYVHILIRDTSRVVLRGHRIIELARRLGSHILIKKLAPQFNTHIEAFCIADETALLRRPIADRYEGQVNFNDRQDCKTALRFFHNAWEHSSPDPELRRLHL